MTDIRSIVQLCDLFPDRIHRLDEVPPQVELVQILLFVGGHQNEDAFAQS